MSIHQITVLEHLLASGLFRSLQNVECLEAAIMGENDRLLPYIAMLISSKLVELTLYLYVVDMDRTAGRYLQSVVASLPVEAPRLRKLEIEKIALQGGEDFEDDGFDMAQNNHSWSFTESISGGALGLASTLTSFTARGVAVCPTEFVGILLLAKYLISASVWLKDRHVLLTQRPRARIATNIQNLSLVVVSLSRAVEVINATQLPKLQSFELRVMREPEFESDGDSDNDHTVREADSTLGDSLQDSMALAILSRVEISIRGEQEEQEVFVSMDFLAAFFPFHKIETFTVTSPVGNILVELNPHFLLQVARSWPRLEEFTLLRTSLRGTWVPALKIKYLLEFILATPSLRLVGVDVDFNATINDMATHFPAAPWHDEVFSKHLIVDVGLAEVVNGPVIIAALLSEALKRSISVQSRLWSEDRFFDNGGQKSLADWSFVEESIRIIRTVRRLSSAVTTC